MTKSLNGHSTVADDHLKPRFNFDFKRIGTMERLKIENLLSTLWHEVEVYLLRINEELSAQKVDDLKKKISDVMEEAERQFSYTFIELGNNDNGKGHHVDAVMEQTISLSLKAGLYLDEPMPQNYRIELLVHFMTSLDNLMVNIRKKFSHFQYAKLTPPPHYIQHIMTTAQPKVQFILKRLLDEGLTRSIFESLNDYFLKPIPANHSSFASLDGFTSLDYFVGLVDSLYEICEISKQGELEEALYYELINRNFNRLQFVRAVIKSITLKDDIEDVSLEIDKLILMRKEVGKIPVISGMAYMHSDLGLKEVLQQAITEEIDYLHTLKDKQEEDSPKITGPIFSSNVNVLILLLMHNVLLNISFLRKIGKSSVPQFIHQNFVRANGEYFSLKSLQKKNSQIDARTAHGLIEILTRMIEYLKRNFL